MLILSGCSQPRTGCGRGWVPAPTVMGARDAQPFCDAFGSGVLEGPRKRRQQPRPAARGTGPSGERDEWACKPNSVPRRGEVVAIYLGHRLLGVSGDLPEETGEQPARTWVETARHLPLAWSCSRWGLPGRPSHLDRRWSLTPPFHSYRAAQVPSYGGAQDRGGDLLSVALAVESPRLGVAQHRALWSSDFPHGEQECAPRDHPAHSSE